MDALVGEVVGLYDTDRQCVRLLKQVWWDDRYGTQPIVTDTHITRPRGYPVSSLEPHTRLPYWFAYAEPRAAGSVWLTTDNKDTFDSRFYGPIRNEYIERYVTLIWSTDN